MEMSNMNIIATRLIDSLENGSISIEEVLNNIDKLIVTDIDLAEQLIKKIKENTNLNGNVLVSYLSNKIKEKRLYDGMSDADRKRYMEYLEMGRDALKTRNYDKAFEFFSEGYKVTGQPVFKYYMGKSAFYQGKLEHSSKYFYEYLALGSKKFSKANLYLWSVAKKCHHISEKSYRIALLYYTPRIFDSETAFDDLFMNLDNIPSRDKVLPASVIVTRNDISCADEEINIKEDNPDCEDIVEMFSGFDEDAIRDFHSFGFEEQIGIIRELYLSGNIFGADQLMGEIEIYAVGNPKRQKVIKQEKGKRQIYVRKAEGK